MKVAGLAIPQMIASADARFQIPMHCELIKMLNYEYTTIVVSFQSSNQYLVTLFSTNRQ